MKTLRNQNYWWKFEQLPLLLYLCKWLFLSVLSGACIGSASALLLVSLEWATQYREHHLWIIALLPVAGLIIGLMYHYWAGTASRGNNYLIEEIRSPHDIIPFRMAPLVYIGTCINSFVRWFCWTRRNRCTDGRSYSRPVFPSVSYASQRSSSDGSNWYQCRFCFCVWYPTGGSRFWFGSHCGRAHAL